MSVKLTDREEKDAGENASMCDTAATERRIKIVEHENAMLDDGNPDADVEIDGCRL